MCDRQEKVAPLVREFQPVAAGLKKGSAVLREMCQSVTELLTQTTESTRHSRASNHRHPRMLLSGIQTQLQPRWIPAPRLRGGRLFAGMTAPEFHE